MLSQAEKKECKRLEKIGEFFVNEFHRDPKGELRVLFSERDTRLSTIEEAFVSGKKAAQPIDVRLLRVALDAVAMGLGAWTPQQRRLYERASNALKKAGA